MNKAIIFAILSFIMTLTIRAQTNANYVNLFIGTTDEGNMYPGATVPFGMVQLSPDTDISKPSGYNYKDSIILGFSHTHLSGTGLGDFGDIMTMPVSHNQQNFSKVFPNFKSAFTHDKEQAFPGYYSVVLDKHDTKVELTSTQRCGLQKISFTKNRSTQGLLVDLSHSIYGLNNVWIPDVVYECKLEVEDKYTISGYKKSKGWAPQQNVYFVMKFDKPISEHFVKSSRNIIRNSNLNTDSLLKTIFLFGNIQNLLVKTGISSVSVEGARKNLAFEIPDWNFEKYRKSAAQTWNDYLQKIKIQADDKEKVLFYTALYHTIVTPNLLSDTDSSFFGPDFKVHKSEYGNYYSTFSLWDTYRSVHPLYTIICPSKNAVFVNSMLEHYQIFGRLPIWTLWGNENYCMTGNPAIPVVVDAFLKGNLKNVDELAWEAVLNSSTKLFSNTTFDVYKHYGFIPNYWGEYGARGDRNRYDLIDKYGYIPHNLLRESATQLLELSYDDWCVAQISLKLGKTKDYKFFYTRSHSYKNIFDNSMGYMRPRLSNGKWQTPFDPYKIFDWQTSAFVEGNSCQYTFYVPHEVDTLIARCGGHTKFEAKLDTLFNSKNNDEHTTVGAVTGFIGQYAHGNEPSHHIAYLYNYVGKHNKTVEKIKLILNTQYSDKPSGLTGNDDCGQMSAWYVFSAMGFYPVNPTSGYYDIGIPKYEKTEILLENGKSFVVRALNLSKENSLVKSIKLNGKVVENYKISHTSIIQGGVLEFEMVDVPK